MIDELLKKDPAIVARTVKQLKQWAANRNKMMSQYNPKLHANFVKSIKDTDNKGWTKEKTMKLAYRIPLAVYMGDPVYWDEIIRTKKFNKHPEWKVT
jgi:hypothetical protein